MTAFFLRIFGITAAMSVFIVVLFVLSRIAGAKFTAKCRYIIWAVVILRLALPISFENGWLVRLELPAEEAEVTVGQMPSALPNSTDFDLLETTADGYSTLVTPDDPDKQDEGEGIPTFSPDLPATEAEPSLAETQNTPAPMPQISPTEQDGAKELPTLSDVTDAAAKIYLIGAVLYLIVRITSHIVYTTSVDRTKKRVPQKLYEEYHALCEALNIKKHPALYASEMADSPMLYGYLRPRIVLPPSVASVASPDSPASQERVVGILTHELTHWKRGDIWLKVIAMLAEALHWFNPLVHFASRRCEQEMELACDEAVLGGMDEDARVSYGYAMLDIVKLCRNRRNTLTTQYSPRKTALKERFENILDMRHKRRGGFIIVLSVILCAAVSVAVSCTVVKAEDQEPSDFSDKTDETLPMHDSSADSGLAEETDEVPLIDVISNGGGMNVKTVTVPMPDADNSSYIIYRLDDRYSICLTYAYTIDKQGRIDAYNSIKVYVVDAKEGRIAAESAEYAPRGPYLPKWISYTTDGCVLYDVTVEDIGVSVVPFAISVKNDNGRFTFAETEAERFPSTTYIVKAPTADVFAAYVMDDLDDSGIELITPNGETKTILDNVTLDSWSIMYTDVSDVRIYTPVGFLDDEHLAYSIGGWDGQIGYGIYNITTDEAKVYENGETPLGVHDGKLLVQETVTRNEGSYTARGAKIREVTQDGKRTLLASTEEEDGVFTLPQDKAWVFEGGVWQILDTSAFSYSRDSEKRLTAELYSPDFTRKLAEIEYPYIAASAESFVTYDDSVTVIVPDFVG